MSNARFVNVLLIVCKHEAPYAGTPWHIPYLDMWLKDPLLYDTRLIERQLRVDLP